MGIWGLGFKVTISIMGTLANYCKEFLVIVT